VVVGSWPGNLPAPGLRPSQSDSVTHGRRAGWGAIFCRPRQQPQEAAGSRAASELVTQ
jgi:hypothetical protein